MSAKTPRERLKEACDSPNGITCPAGCMYHSGSLYEAARAVLDELEPEPAPRAMTKAERNLCNWAKFGVRYSDLCGPHPALTELANAVWDEAHPTTQAKRTLEDVERDLGGWTAQSLDGLQPLFDERRRLIDKENES